MKESRTLPTTLINGREAEQVSVLDRGFQYGDGLFETIRIVGGVPEFWQQHFRRLSEGCQRLNIPIPEQSVILAEVGQLCDNVNDNMDVILKIIITRGVGGRGYAVSDYINPTRVIAVFSAPQYTEDYRIRGVTIRVCETRLGNNPALAGLKHLNRLEQVLARAEWDDPDIIEGLMLDTQGNVIEGTMTNFFSVKNNELFTPELSLCGVKGIMRGQVIIAANQLDIAVHEMQLDLDTLYQSDELFLCNSLIGIWPVSRLENQMFNVGPVSHHLANTISNQGHV